MYSGIQQNQYGVQKMHRNKLHLIKAPGFSKFSWGSSSFLSEEGAGCSPTLQGCHYCDEIVLPATLQFPPATYFKRLERSIHLYDCSTSWVNLNIVSLYKPVSLSKIKVLCCLNVDNYLQELCYSYRNNWGPVRE